MTKYKNFLLLIINNKNNISKENNINTLRYYGIGAQIIKDLNVKNMILISRSKKKLIGLEGFGLKIKKTNNNKMKKILIINSNYYKKISKNLVLKAKKKLLKTKFKVSILDVPGVYEIPIAIRKNIKNLMVLLLWVV